MLIFQRSIEQQISAHLKKSGILILLGPRQSGKTTLAKKVLAPLGNDGAYFNCEHADVRQHFMLGEPDALLSLIGDKKVVVFDEAQTIQNIGKILKVFYDTYPETKIIATGSSSFDLANKIKEPLTGRATEYTLYPLSLAEVRTALPVDRAELGSLMTYGSYPAVVAKRSAEEKLEALKNIATNYLYKDIFIFEAIRNPKALEDLMTHLSFRVGSTVSTHDLSKEIGITQVTVEKYLRLLEQSFVIRRVYSFARNYANELKKSYKVYFLDNGVRNILAGVLHGATDAGELGVLFESYVLTEFLKRDALELVPPVIHFWRTRDKKEIDFVRVRGRDIHAYECKWKDTNVSFSLFKKYYPNARVEVVTPDTLLQ